jgi:hypothetical protein
MKAPDAGEKRASDKATPLFAKYMCLVYSLLALSDPDCEKRDPGI